MKIIIISSNNSLSLLLGLFFLLKFSLILGSGFLILLVLGHQIVHVGFCLGELHFVHAFAGVPMKESLSSEHSYKNKNKLVRLHVIHSTINNKKHTSELLRNTTEQFLDSGGISNESGRHLETTGWNIAHCSLDVVGDPFNEV